MGQNLTHPMKQPKGFCVRPKGRAVDPVALGEAPPPLIASLKKALGDEVRIQPAPCVGRCEAAPVVDIHPEDLSQLGGAVKVTAGEAHA